MPIRVGIVGLGNCASALVQGTHKYVSDKVGRVVLEDKPDGLTRPRIGPYGPDDLSFVVAFDVDKRKIGQPIQKAIFEKPNCCAVLDGSVTNDLTGRFNGPVLKAPLLDGVSDHMRATGPEDAERFYIDSSNDSSVTIEQYADKLKTFGVDVLVNYLPVGSQQATEFWANVCLEARVPLVNCIPVFIASNPLWHERFKAAGVALIGDDMKSQFGASVLSQMFQELAEARGHKVKVHIQQNSGGNTDFLNMTNQGRLASKKISKENVLKSHGAIPEFFHAGPSDYIRHYKDTKVAHFRVELEGFCGAPVTLDARLEVQDSPNSAGVVIDAIRYVKVAQDFGLYGALEGPSAFTQKSPPVQMSLADAIKQCDALSAKVYNKCRLE